MATRAEAKVTTDHDEIRRWAEERGAQPACVRNTGEEGDIGILRLDFPGYSGADSLEHISWDDFFQKFDERGLALLHQDTTAGGEESNFNKLISRETAEARAEGKQGRSNSRGRSASRRARSTSARGGARKKTAARSTRSSGRKASAKKKTAAKSGRASTSRSRSAARSGAKRSSATRGRSTAAKRSSSSPSRSRNEGGRSTSSRSKTGAKRSTARKSASGGRTRSTRGRTTTSSRSGSKRGRSSGSKTRRAASTKHAAGSTSSHSRILTDHDDIRRWAEEREAHPACVRGTGRKKNDTGMIRLDFPGYSGARSLQPVEWDDWFQQFEDNNLALVVQDETARGQRSNFNKIIGRETPAMRKQRGGHASRRHPERGSKTAGSVKVHGSRAQTKATRGSNRGARTASARGQHRQEERRAA